MRQNQLYFGDNLDILRQKLAPESVDLIYLDPPFNSKADYNVLFKESDGQSSSAQITAFKDTWHWNIEAEEEYRETVLAGGPLSDLLQAFRGFLGANDMMAYLTMMAPRLTELHRVLKPTGSLYLHCDPTASHYLKLLLDAVFHKDNFRNEIIWKRTSAHNSAKRWGPVHDVILFYTKSDQYLWNRLLLEYDAEYIRRNYRHQDQRGYFKLSDLTGAGLRKGDSGKPWKDVNPSAKKRHWAIPNTLLLDVMSEDEISVLSSQEKLDILNEHGFIHFSKQGIPLYKKYLGKGSNIQDVITDISPLSANAAERLGYPTQKPESLLERILQASSNEGDVVLDPFCGCGTTVAVAEKLKRRWIGIDITHLAVTLMRHRLAGTFGEEISPYQVLGTPTDLAGARALAGHDRYQFEWWALGLVDARPAQDKKKGADSGVDGYIYFFDDESGKAKKLIIQVKSGKVSVSQIRDLKGAMEREKAVMAAFLTLEPATKPMLQEAVETGVYVPALFQQHQYPKIQILTIEELLAGTVLKHPKMALATFKPAPRHQADNGQEGLFE